MLSVDEARQKILATLEKLPERLVLLEDAAGRALAVDIRASQNLPPFTNSSMDGYAVKAEDVRGAEPGNPAMLKVTGEIQAGASEAGSIGRGEAAAIMTGAPLPEGADAVVPVEETHTDGSGTVWISRAVKRGDSIRPEGQDVRAGAVVLQAGKMLGAQDIGLLASLGYRSVPVIPSPRVAIFSSGDELVEPGETPGPGQIPNANSYMLAALIQQAGAEVLSLPLARDDPDEIRARFEQAVREGADLILTSAGVSVGEYDYVRSVIEAEGELSFWKVNMRPGKPLAFGHYRQTPFIGLPGNPVSAYVGFRVFVEPALAKMAGHQQQQTTKTRAILAEEVHSDGRESYLRAEAFEQNGTLYAKLAGHQGSGNLAALSQANALLIVPSGVKSLAINTEVEIWFLNR